MRTASVLARAGAVHLAGGPRSARGAPSPTSPHLHSSAPPLSPALARSAPFRAPPWGGVEVGDPNLRSDPLCSEPLPEEGLGSEIRTSVPIPSVPSPSLGRGWVG